MNPVLKYRGGKSRDIYQMISIVTLNLFWEVELFSFILSPIVRLSMMQIRG